MNSIWLSLLWKEWREQRWKLVALVGTLVTVPLLTSWSFADEAEYDRIFGIMALSGASIFLYTTIVSLFIAMSLSASENSRRTMRFLQSQPAPMWQCGLVKLAMGVSVLLIPMLCLVGVQWLLVSRLDLTNHLQQEAMQHLNRQLNWGIENYYLGQVVVGSLSSVSLLIWAVAAGTGRSDEVRAGAVGFLVIAGVWLAFTLGVKLAEESMGPALTNRAVLWYAALPGGPGFVTRVTISGSTSNVVMFSVIGVLSHAAVLFWFLKQFGRVALPTQRTVAKGWDFISWRATHPLPLRTPLAAIVWKQLRETGPLAVFAAAGILAFVPLIYWWNRSQGGTEYFSDMLIAVTSSVGVMVAMVVGIGVLLQDYAPGVNNFWRSRPVNLHAWFAIKYVAGFAVLVFSFGPLLIYAATLNNWEGVTFADASVVVAGFLAIYTMAVAGYSLLRQPIYAAVATFCGIFTAMAYMDAIFPSPAYFWRAIILCSLSFVTLISLAWQAVVRDWGWKQGR